MPASSSWMRKALRRLKGYTGRVMRDIERQLGKVPEGALRDGPGGSDRAGDTGCWRRSRSDKLKLYSLVEPAVDCISKGKAAQEVRVRNLCQLSATTNRGGFVVTMRALPSNPYDGQHFCGETLEQVEILTDLPLELAFVDPLIPRAWRAECEGFSSVAQSEVSPGRLPNSCDGAAPLNQ